MLIRLIHQSSFSHPAFSDSTECCSSFTFRFTSVPSFCSFCTSCCAWSRAVFNSPTCDSNCYQIKVKHKISVCKIVFQWNKLDTKLSSGQNWYASNLMETLKLLYTLFWGHHFVFTFFQTRFQLCALLPLLLKALGLLLHLLLHFIQLLHKRRGCGTEGGIEVRQA